MTHKKQCKQQRRLGRKCGAAGVPRQYMYRALGSVFRLSRLFEAARIVCVRLFHRTSVLWAGDIDTDSRGRRAAGNCG